MSDLTPSPLRIALLLYPRCMPAGLFAFADLVHAANRRAGKTIFETRFVGLEAGAVACAHGQTLNADSSLALACCHAVLVPGFWAEAAQQVVDRLDGCQALVAALKRLPHGVQLWSYCTGVCLLAASGRLNRQQATVTWWLADLMRTAYPHVLWRNERTDVVEERVATASGVNGYLPIAQALIERHVSIEVGRDLAQLMVLPRPLRSHPVFQVMNLVEQPGSLLRRLYQKAEGIPACEVTVRRLAAELQTTERTLARKVSAAAGVPAASYLRRIKLNQVSERLILTSVPASTISAELGFSSDSSMRRMFRELTGMTPAQYRVAFGGR